MLAKTKNHIEMKRQKEMYSTPTAEVVEVEVKGVIAASGGPYAGFHHSNGGTTEEYLW